MRFQSPSLRGSGRFSGARLGGSGQPHGVSIPFIAGQWSLPSRMPRTWTSLRGVSIPFIAGQWSLRRDGRPGPQRREVSIPFIAGQWSLRDDHRTRRRRRRACFNPLHCGAVVASQWRSPPRRRTRRCFNPLHCGAVVASREDNHDDRDSGRFQSPSLRGSGRFIRIFAAPCGAARFNPLHCGAVVASR